MDNAYNDGFEVFIITAEPVEKVLPITRELEQSMLKNFATHVLSGSPDIGDKSQIETPIRISHFPGESVFHLRSRIPALARDCGWTIILEDHNLLDASWPAHVSAALDRAAPEVTTIIGAAANTRSTDAWSWANFLNVLGFHWAPEICIPIEPLGFNVALRRDVLGRERLALGQYETEIVPQAMKNAIVDSSFPVTHTQFRAFPEVFYYQWCNGRATGAFMRQFDELGMGKTLSHARRSSFHRQKSLRAALRCHPLRSQLPRGTFLRVQLLAFAHSLGSIYGGLAGEGGSLWELE